MKQNVDLFISDLKKWKKIHKGMNITDYEVYNILKLVSLQNTDSQKTIPIIKNIDSYIKIITNHTKKARLHKEGFALEITRNEFCNLIKINAKTLYRWEQSGVLLKGCVEKYNIKPGLTIISLTAVLWNFNELKIKYTNIRKQKYTNSEFM